MAVEDAMPYAGAAALALAPAPYGAVAVAKSGRPGSWPPPILRPPPAAAAAWSQTNQQFQAEFAELAEIKSQVERAENRAWVFRDELRSATDTARARYASEKAELEGGHASSVQRLHAEHAQVSEEHRVVRTQYIALEASKATLAQEYHG